MINLISKENQKLNQVKLVEILFYFFPLSFILGNLILTLNLLFFIVFSLLLIKKKKLASRFSSPYLIIFIFLLYFTVLSTIQFETSEFLNGSIQNWPFTSHPGFKAFTLVRFLIFIVVLDTLFYNKILNLKKFFLSSLICTTFVSIDIIVQYINGYDLFGLESFGKWNTGPFGSEGIAGSYLVKFSFFSFFSILEIFKNKKIKFPLLVFIIALHLTATMLSGNRMPLILLLFGCSLIFLFVKNLRLAIPVGVLIFLSIFFLIIKNDANFKSAYFNFFSQFIISESLSTLKKADKDVNEVSNDIKKNTTNLPTAPKNYREKYFHLLWGSGHNKIFRTALVIWKEKPLFGFGYKSFRLKCWEILTKDNIARGIQRPQFIACANHPHNYYLEFLSEAGTIGAILMIVFFLILLKDSFSYIKKYYQKNGIELILIMPIITNIIIEIWPIRSTGSFFTTWGATHFWLNVAIFFSALALSKTKNANYS